MTILIVLHVTQPPILNTNYKCIFKFLDQKTSSSILSTHVQREYNIYQNVSHICLNHQNTQFLKPIHDVILLKTICRPSFVMIITNIKYFALWEATILQNTVWEYAIYGYKLTVHFHIWLFCDVTDRLLFVCGYYSVEYSMRI